MNHIHPIRQVTSMLAGLAVGLLALITAAPAAFAKPWPWTHRPVAPATPRPHAMAPSALAGWQVIAIVAAAGLLATAIAVTVYRMRAARRRTTPTAA